jgi:hypothetical protein
MKKQFIFKQKLLVTVIASALGLHGGVAQAVQCDIIGTATRAEGSTPVNVGPLNPTNGFPEYITDSTGLSVQRCLDPALCFFDPIVQSDPYSLQIGSGGEAFYWSAGNTVNNAAGVKILGYEAAAETAFLENGPNGEPIDGSQFAFLRIRFTMDLPRDGIYTVIHPYGADTFTVTGATGNRDVFFTIDKGMTPNSDVLGPVGEFLVADPAFSTVPAGFLGDAAGVPVVAKGSPCGRNFVQVTGVDTLGNPIDFGSGEFSVTSNLFTIQGQLYDGQVQTPMTPTRLSYTRGLSGPGQIDSFATSTATASVTVEDGPTIPVGSGQIPTPALLDFDSLFDAIGSVIGGMDSTSVPVANPVTLPPIVKMTATDTGALTDPTALNLHLRDFVDISQADYDPATQELTVTAASSDKLQSPNLMLREFGPFTAGEASKVVSTLAPPAVVHVDSALGGSDIAQVRVITPVTPIAPSALALSSATSHTLTVTWVDNSISEQGFKIYLVDADTGNRTLQATNSANTTQATISGLAAGQTYTIQVDAFNTVGAGASTSFSADTLALPVAPSGVITGLSTTVVRGIDVSWVDNSGDETGFTISRSTLATGVFTPIATVAADVTSLVDSVGIETGTTYFYQVTAVRGADSSTEAQSAVLATPLLPTAPVISFGTVNTTSAVINWSDLSTDETSFQVYRSSSATGLTGYAAVSGLLPANTVSFTDSGLASSQRYFYRVDVSNWAGTVSSVFQSVTTASATVLAAPDTVSATQANRPVLRWADTSTGETNYRVGRTPYTVAANGTVTVGARTVLSSLLAPNTITFTDTTAARDQTYRYDVQALNGATVGPQSVVFTVAGALSTANRPTLVRSLVGAGVNATARVALTWTALTTSNVGGYVIERCAGAGCTNFAKVNGTAVNTLGTVDGRATRTFTDATVARATSYTYRMRAVSGKGVTGFTYPANTLAAASTIVTQ